MLNNQNSIKNTSGTMSRKSTIENEKAFSI